MKYTTLNEYDVDAADVTVKCGQAIKLGIPAEGVITVYFKE